MDNDLEADIRLMRNFEQESTLMHIPKLAQDGHNGADRIIRKDIFTPRKSDELEQRSDMRAGLLASLIGIAGYTSITTGRPVRIKELVDFG